MHLDARCLACWQKDEQSSRKKIEWKNIDSGRPRRSKEPRGGASALLIFNIIQRYKINQSSPQWTGRVRNTAAQCSYIILVHREPTLSPYFLASMRHLSLVIQQLASLLPPRLYQSAAGWRFCRLLRSVNYHMLATCQEHSKKNSFHVPFSKRKKILSRMNLPVCFEQLACPILLLFDTLT